MTDRQIAEAAALWAWEVATQNVTEGEIDAAASISLLPQKPDFTVRFHCDGREVGCFDFGQAPATFEGDVDESARLFVEAVLRNMPNLSR